MFREAHGTKQTKRKDEYQRRRNGTWYLWIMKVEAENWKGTWRRNARSRTEEHKLQNKQYFRQETLTIKPLKNWKLLLLYTYSGDLWYAHSETLQDQTNANPIMYEHQQTWINGFTCNDLHKIIIKVNREMTKRIDASAGIRTKRPIYPTIIWSCTR